MDSWLRLIRRLQHAQSDLLWRRRRSDGNTRDGLEERLEGFATRDVRRLLVGQCEMRYEISAATVYVLRLWHTREHR